MENSELEPRQRFEIVAKSDGSYINARERGRERFWSIRPQRMGALWGSVWETALPFFSTQTTNDAAEHYGSG